MEKSDYFSEENIEIAMGKRTSVFYDDVEKKKAFFDVEKRRVCQKGNMPYMSLKSSSKGSSLFLVVEAN